MRRTNILCRINILLISKRIYYAGLFFFLLIIQGKTIGQIVNQKGVFVSYEVFYRGYQDCHGSASFIMFVDSINSNQFAKNLENFSSKDCLSSTCFLDYFFNRKKIYCDYSLLLQSIYKCSDSLKAILEPYKKEYPEDKLDNVISKRLIHKIQYSIINKNKEEKHIFKYEITIRLFYGKLTFLDCQGKDGKSLVKRAEWGWDSINHVYLSGVGSKTGNIGVLLKLE